ncbi:unnamed protein product [Pieris macdunnoughi]|uniref:Glucosylceramidase n=1 Tax=Pieris macdunnoughi TaxID=345717 RepID=A0A821U7J1_9NEOP|nr:unnamed protein product [Pieris macdunnoughi]
MITKIIFSFIFISCIVKTKSDKPCAVKHILGQSIVCVCNSTYCDDFIREPPTEGYITYTSSKAGLRFKKEVHSFLNASDKNCVKCSEIHLDVDPSVTYQRIEGFGGAVTDSAGINWKSLEPALQYYMIKSYYSEEGLEYNMARVPIGGTDFSTRKYAYNELPVDDVNLTNFHLAHEDYNYKIPMLWAIQNTSNVPIHIVSTTWSPPPWMKTNNAFTGYSRLKEKYYQTYADYHYRFIEEYEAVGIPIWAITTTNEPINGVFNLAGFNSLGWSVNELGNWIVNHLGPTIRNSKYKNVKILTCDDQRFTIPFFFNMMLNKHPKALDIIDGIGVHFYHDRITPASIFNFVTKYYPDKFILATEASEGAFPWQAKVLLGSWNRAESYISDILEDLNHNLVGWIDWNLCLNLIGGPNWELNFVDSPIIVNALRQEFYKQPMFYALGQVSKFVPRDSIRIQVNETKSFFQTSVKHVGFLTPRNTTVLILYNSEKEQSITVRCVDNIMHLQLPARSITTVEFQTKKKEMKPEDLLDHS